jgi:hypothetical protein
MTDEERMAERSPHEEPYRRPTWDEIQQEHADWERWRMERDADWKRRRSASRAVIDMIKRQEELAAARRRCWLF